MDRRIAPPKDLEDVLAALTESGQMVFETKQKAMMLAAAIGAYEGKHLPLERRDTAAAIRFEIFEKALDDGFVNALAVWHSKSLDVLADDRTEERLTIFEEYAHAGLVEVKKRCFERPGDVLNVLLQWAYESRVRAPETVGEVDRALLKNLLD